MTPLARSLARGALVAMGLGVVCGLLGMGGVAGAAQRSAPPASKEIPSPYNYYNTYDAGTANSSITHFGPMVLSTLQLTCDTKAGVAHGVNCPVKYQVVDGLLSYGDSAVLYSLPIPKVDLSVPAQESFLSLGQELYANNCQACHGPEAQGIPPAGTPSGGGFPTLTGVGPATINFWVDSGRMPATDTHLTQQNRRPSRLDHMQSLAIAAFLNSLDPATPYIPDVNTAQANLADGFALFSLNCAACHTITGDGDALANDTFAPSLRNIPAYQVAEALRTGPANMPVFTGNLSDQQLADVVNYVVHRIQHPQNPGGLGLGGIGPVGEGFIGLALGVGLLALVGFWVGDRS